MILLLPASVSPQAITKGFFADFPAAVKEAAESIVNARYCNIHVYAEYMVSVR